MLIYDVKINGMRNPLGYRFGEPVCSWKVKDAKGKRQERVRIEVSADESFLHPVYEKEGKDLNSLAEPLDFALIPHTRYFCRVTVEDELGDRASSETVWFETAKVNEPWIGSWIGTETCDTFHPEFIKNFGVKGKVESARLYICGLGLFEAKINGKKAGDDLLAPFITDYRESVQYCTYDITQLLKEENECSVCLGNGWYKGRFGFTGDCGFFGKEFLLRAEIRIQYQDGTQETVGTDKSWRYRGSIFEETDIYDGEKQNYLLWAASDNPWKTAVVKEISLPLTERYSLPLHVMEELPVREVIHTPAGETVLDFGQNFAGYVECRTDLPRGACMTLEFGEILQDGNFYHDNYRTARSTFTYVSDGVSRTVRPYFTFYGFRYVKVSGQDNTDAKLFTGRAVYSEMERTGYIETSDVKINRLFENTLWGMKSNFLDMPTDCPQRDERLGWTGDAQVFAWTAAYHMDTRAFYRKFLRDLRLDQLQNGGKVAVFLPNTYRGVTASVWGDIATFLPAMLYQYYGDETALKEDYPLMRDWVEYIHGEDRKRGTHNLYDFGFQFGDWLALDGATPQSNYGRTDNTYVASAYYYASVNYVAKTAKILGYEEDERIYRELAGHILEAMLAEFFTPSGRLAIDTQTGYLIALKFGIYRDRQKIIDGLRKRMEADCYRIKGGFVGATMMNTVLADHGMTDLAYDFLFFEGFPGWLYEINLGATTIWERWNSVLPDGKISGTSMNSLNHYAYGSVVEFLYKHAAGIQPAAPGFKRVCISPKPDGRFRFFNCTYESAAGTYVSNWMIKEDGMLAFHIEIPFGASARVELPDKDNGVFELEAGSYDFIYRPKRDYRKIFTEKTRLEYLLADPAARQILFEELPDTKTMYEVNEIEGLSKTLLYMKRQAQFLHIPTERYDRAIGRIHALYEEETV